MKRLGPIAALAGACAAVFALAAGEPGDTIVTRTYDVHDLVAPGRAARAAGAEGEADRLAEAVKALAAPGLWHGDAAAAVHDGLLVVRQTEHAQAEVEAVLEALRRHASAARRLSIEARWVRMPREMFERIRRSAAGAAVVDPEALEKAGAETVARCATVCRDRQPAHLASGRTREILSDIEPAVMGNGLGYAASSEPHFDGAALDVLPSLTPDGDAVLLELTSTLTTPVAVREKPVRLAIVAGDEAGKTDATLDLPEDLVHTLQATARAMLGKATLVAGMTPPEGGPEEVIALVVEVGEASE